MRQTNPKRIEERLMDHLHDGPSSRRELRMHLDVEGWIVEEILADLVVKGLISLEGDLYYLKRTKTRGLVRSLIPMKPVRQ